MKPELILRSDILDILFENRNKAYGAYYLRKHYNSHLLAGLMGMFMFSVGLWIFSNGNKGDDKVYGPPPFIVTDTIRLSPPVDFDTDPVHPKPKAQSRQDIPNPKSLSYVIGPDLARMDEPDQPSPGQDTEETGNQTGGQGGETTGTDNNVSQAATKAPIPAPEEVEPEVYLSPAVMPQFPGGEAALTRWLSRQLRPADEMQPGQKVKVLVRFVVNKLGNIEKIELIQPGGEPYDKEVLRVIGKMPRWEPGRQNGHNVSAWFLIPIIFEMPEQ